MQMKDFYHAQYSSNIMCLSVYGAQSLDDLEILAKEKFAAVPNSNLPPANIPSKNLKVQNTVKKVCSGWQFLISCCGKTQLVTCTSIMYTVCKPYVMQRQKQSRGCRSSPGDACCLDQQKTASWSLPMAALPGNCLCTHVIVCC